MGWEILEIDFDAHERAPQSIGFELELNGGAGRQIVTGDGILQRDGSIRINRESHLSSLLSGDGADGEAQLARLRAELAAHITKARAQTPLSAVAV